MDDCLIDTLLDVVANGCKSANGFKKEMYKIVVESVRRALGISVMEKHVSNRLRTLKRLYFEVRDTLNASWFGWDDDKKLVTTSDDVWDDYIWSHPYAQHVRGKPVRRYDDFVFLFGSNRATGLRATTGNMYTQSGMRKSCDDDVTLTASVDLNDDTLVLSSDDMPKKLYVVFKGRRPGIYHNWEECRQQVDGYSCARFCGYKSMKEALV
ncbi:uncharacterized protein At2g29880-like [Magnolia sinica]|uniref:uncharacterized protein At2g29880-like n=1 Tax=Magnolia sinica TaxID=86752 RepID=UPI002658A343|nr:uncharacterized protein At2g29880-like [Magnolia sinica]